MQQPLVRMSQEIRQENKEHLNNILLKAKEVGAIGVEIPFVDASSIKNETEKNELISCMQEAFELAKEIGIRISLETDLNPTSFKELLDRINLNHVQANYDIGNSASLGFDPIEEIDAIGKRILNVHVKDRKLGGTTVPLGTGDADIKLSLSRLSELNYSGGITMQAARGTDDINVAKSQLKYTLEIINNI
jgi:hexulose-6-phosphate isomerase